MTKWEKEILQAYLQLEADTQKKFRKIFEKALKNTCDAVKQLALSEIMEQLEQEQPGGSNGRNNVYQRKYQKEIETALNGPFDELEQEEEKALEESMNQYFMLGLVSAAYMLHRQNVPLIIPAKKIGAVKQGTESGFIVRFSGPQVAEWYRYIRRDIKNLKIQTVADVTRAITQGLPYGEIARSMAQNMQSNLTGTPFKKELNKAMRIVRTEGGRIHNESQYTRECNLERVWNRGICT